MSCPQIKRRILNENYSNLQLCILEHNRGKHDRPSDMSEGGNSSGYVVPSEFNEKYLKT